MWMFNKYTIFFVIIFFMIFSTFLAQSLDISTTSDIVGNLPQKGTGFLGTGIGSEAQFILDFISYFFKLLFFRIDGIPNVIVLLVYWPLTFVNIWIFMDLVRGN